MQTLHGAQAEGQVDMMTAQELKAEWQHVFETRLGVLCGSGRLSQDQIVMAKMEADEHVERLKGW